ncbi:hypothetical protein M5D96_002533, partial [Drosophila gunungcola]
CVDVFGPCILSGFCPSQSKTHPLKKRARLSVFKTGKKVLPT